MKMFLLVCAIMLCWTYSYSQNITVTGIVTDEKGEAIPNASIVIKGTKTGVVTDIHGRFTINVFSESSTLVISSIGCISQEVRVGNNRTFSVALQSVELNMSEVVVVGYGVRRAKMTTASVSTVRYSEVKQLKTWKRSGSLDENSVQLAVGDKDFLPLKSVQVAVQVDGFRARILFDYIFYSDKKMQLRGNFKLKLPNGASPSYFAFGGIEYFNADKTKSSSTFIDYPAERLHLVNDTITTQRNKDGNKIREAIVAPKEKSAYAFNEVVRGKVDPALMEWAGADVFSCSVYPIQPDKLHRVVVGYDVNLLESGADALLELTLPYGKIPKKLDIDIAELKHKIEPAINNERRNGNRTRYHLRDFADQKFSIYISEQQPVFLHNDADKYFAVSYKAQLPVIPRIDNSGKAIFMLDVSLSSQPDKFNVWLKTIETILHKNRKQIPSFAILCFNVDYFWWKNEWTPNTDYKVGEFLEFADNLSLSGATDLGLALKEAGKPSWMKKNKEEAKTLFLMSDGDASWGESSAFRLSSLIPPSDRIFTFTTGLAGTDTRILDNLSRQSNGAVFSVLNEDEVENVAEAIKYQPWRIKSLALKNGSDLLIAGRPYSVYNGQKLLISGRGNINPNDEVILVLQSGNQEKKISIPASLIIASNLSNRVYGQTAVNQLEEFAFMTEDASVKYATHFNVAGQTCSWIMMETRDLYSRYRINPGQTKSFIDSTHVNDIIAGVLRTSNFESNLASAKENMSAWIKKVKDEKILNITIDETLRQYLEQMPESEYNIDVTPLHSNVNTRDALFRSTRNQLEQNNLEYREFMKAVKRERSIEGNATAFKLISSFAETNREDLTLLRDVAFMLSEWGLDGKSYELLRRLIHSRPAEAFTYNLIANSLVRMKKIDLALLYYDIAFNTVWDERFDGFEIITAIEYYKLLKAIKNNTYKTTNSSFVQKRLADVKSFLDLEKIDAEEADLMIVITWNTDNTDVDLHVMEPNNQECSYRQSETSNGGMLTNDAVEGFGPETYIIKNAPKGKYRLNIDYYSSSRVQTSTSSKILVTAYRNWGRANEERIQKVVELKKSSRSRDDEEDEKMLKDVLVMEF